MADGVAEDLELREQVRQLRDDQDRLWREQDRLKKQAESSGPGGGEKSKGEQDQGGAPPDQTTPGTKADPKADDKDAKKDEKQEEKKPKGSWPREHPIALVVVLIL